MSASTVLGDVTTTLVELIRDQQDPADSFTVTVIPPGDDIPATQQPVVNLYLFRVEENEFAQNLNWRANGTNQLTREPLALNLIYVLTPHAQDQTAAFRAASDSRSCSNVRVGVINEE